MQNNSNCGCNDYSQVVTNLGISNITDANPTMTGDGAVTNIFVARGHFGSVVNSITLKFTEPVTTLGMIRLFIEKSASSGTLIREIPIGVFPQLVSTPTPFPLMPMLEICIIQDIQLAMGQKLNATTQFNTDVNVIVDGVDRTYPTTLPPGCCSFVQEAIAVGNAIISEANPNLDGSGSITNIITGAGNGTRIESIIISALSSTQDDIVRLFLYDGGDEDTKYLWTEIMIPATVQASLVPSYKVDIPENFNLSNAKIIGASTSIGQQYAITIEGKQWSYPAF